MSEVKERDEDGLYEHYHFRADKRQSPLRVDKFLVNFTESLSRNKIQKAAENGNVFVNDESVKSNYKVKPGDDVKMKFEHPPYEFLLVPEDIPIEVIYEDDSLLVVNKEAGMVVHPGHGNYSGTLLNALVYHFENLPENSSERPGLVHRIDKETSGLLVVAKTQNALTHLASQFYHKTSTREYIALVWGNIEEEEGMVEGAIGRHPKNRLQQTVFEDDGSEKGKNAVTHFKVLERFGYVTLVSCRLETGRTHQIRVHMKYYGHTLFNDSRYGGDRILKGTSFSKYRQFVQNCFKILPRQALHAKTLGFDHPVSGKRVNFDSEIPEDMQTCIEKWRHYAKNQKAFL